jgi:hypothetical protein
MDTEAASTAAASLDIDGKLAETRGGSRMKGDFVF